jgi:hypothetical protein
MLGMHWNKIRARQVELLPLAFARLTTEQKNQYLEWIRLLEQKGEAVATSERIEFLSHLVRMQNHGQIPRVEAVPSTVLRSGWNKRLVTKDAIEPQQSSPLVPVFPVSSSVPPAATA